MADEKQNNPAFAFKDIPFGQSIEITLDSSGPVKTGENRYGTWNLWFGIVTNAKVREGRGTTAKVVENYSGKVIFFPSKVLNENLIKLANGMVDVKVKVTKTVKDGLYGNPITNYEVEKLSDGRPNESSITPTEMRLITEANECLEETGYEMTRDLFIKASQEPQYENKISIERSKELFNHYNKK